MDACESFAKRTYGYDTVDMSFESREDGSQKIIFTERPQEKLPTADQIEEDYDHSAHPNPLMSGEAA